ncbi:MAG TPA: BatD family protein [Thermoanaerobaculia bacterium]|nr:BatD family protein [Thermoanaerobaculia bacterium]
MRRAFVALIFAATAAFANELTVDRHTISTDDTVTIIVTLEGAFANLDTVNIPLRNLQMDGPPSVSTEFAWINGTTSRRKTLRYSAHPLAPGGALVGPIVINGDGGQRDTLAPVSIQVLPDETAQSNDPLTILHALVTTNREPFFVVTDVDKSSCYTGEEIIVTWYLYNGATVQRWQIDRVPKLEDFWTEEIDVRNEPPEQVIVGTTVLEKVPVRRIALFPLHSGTLQLGPTTIEAEVLRRMDDSPFGLFEGSVVDVRTSSAPVSIDVKPLPPAAANDIVGDVDLDCGAATQANGGPVTLTVGLSGRANLRAAPAPHFDGPVDGEVEVQPLAVEANKTREGASMSRKWRFVIFPAHSGTLTLPPVAAEAFNPATAQRMHLRCGPTALAVQQVAREPASGIRHPADARKREWRPWAGGILLLAVVIAIVTPPLRRAAATRRDVREIATGGLHSFLIRKKIDETALANEISDRGDAYRSLISLFDAIQRERIPIEEADVDQRARDLVESLR